MRVILEPARAGVAAPVSVLLLPPALAAARDLLEAGFAAAVGQQGLDIDLAFIDPELPFVDDPTLPERLQREAVLPARQRGCRSLWLGGISLGAFLALGFAARFPGEVDGICLLSPYLGNRIAIGEIERAGGVERWQPPVGEEDDERRIWGFLKAAPAAGPPLHLGYGLQDRFAHSHRLLAAALPADWVDSVPGGHDWRVWRTLWENFLIRRLAVAAL
jgi:pimeloyl-ACP methyl ester carboxylesterase